MPNTTRGYPYPALSDPANGPVAFQNLAQAVDTDMATRATATWVTESSAFVVMSTSAITSTSATWTAWVTFPNVTVPTWATRALVQAFVYGYGASTTSALNVSSRVLLGAVAGPALRINGSTQTTATLAMPVGGLLTGLTSGSQALVIQSSFVGGTAGTTFSAPMNAWAAVTFLP